MTRKNYRFDKVYLVIKSHNLSEYDLYATINFKNIVSIITTIRRNAV
jgi:hypothetical protein